MEQDLSNVYSRSVQGRGSVHMGLGGSSGFSSGYERDPYFSQLENSVFSKINELTKHHEVPRVPQLKQSTLRTISYEEALKELLELEKANFEEPPQVS
jgi:hypothetical protein